MAALTIAQVVYLSQELNIHLQDVKRLTAKASFALERARLSLNELLVTYEQWCAEEELKRTRH